MHEERAKISWDRRIAGLAAEQHGVVSRQQLRELDMPDYRTDNRLRAGRLHRIRHGVYAVGHGVISQHGRWLAAVLACGDGAVLSHRSAAALWGLRPSRAASVEVTVPSLSGRRRRRGLLVHRVASLPAAEATRREAIPVTTPARTLLDLAAVVRGDALERAIEQAERLRIFDLRAVNAVLERNVGRSGSARLAAVINDWTDLPLTRSELERRFLALCANQPLPPPAVNVRISGYEVDFLWRDAGLIVETDGRLGHRTHAAFERDRARDAQLTALGWRVIRFSYRQVIDEPEWVTGLLAKLMAQPERSISSTR